MKIRGAVLERTGGPLTVCELDLARAEGRRRCSSGCTRAASATPT